MTGSSQDLLHGKEMQIEAFDCRCQLLNVICCVRS